MALEWKRYCRRRGTRRRFGEAQIIYCYNNNNLIINVVLKFLSISVLFFMLRQKNATRAKKLAKQMERVQIQLSEEKTRNRELNAQLTEAADYKVSFCRLCIQRHVSNCAGVSKSILAYILFRDQHPLCSKIKTLQIQIIALSQLI